MDSGPRDLRACQDVPFIASVNSQKELQGKPLPGSIASALKHPAGRG